MCCSLKTVVAARNLLAVKGEREGGINLQFSIYKFNSDIQITKINKLKENKSQFAKEVDMLRLLNENT